MTSGAVAGRQAVAVDNPSMKFSVSEYVRWEDIDAAGIINYQAYLRFFGLAEVELFRSCDLSYKTMFDEIGVWLPRVHVECDFHHPVRLDDLLVVNAWFGRLGNSSIQLDFEAHRDGEPERIVATGQYVLVTVARNEFRRVPIPELVRERLSRYVES